jgi:hypothetical protein
MKILKKYLLYSVLSVSICILSSCASINVSSYSSNKPKMQPEVFFDGPMTAHGVVKDRAGKVIRYFNADIKGSFDGQVITLDEDFIFDDGEKQKRVWKIIKQADGTYIGTAGDVVGDAIGEISGNSMFLKYKLDVTLDNDKSIYIDIDDRMYLVDPNILINESNMTKFGLRVGQIILVIKKI